MSVGYMINRAVLRADQLCAGAHLRWFERGGCLITVFLHGLFLDEEEVRQDWCYPQQGTTVEHLRRLIVYFQSAGYRFVSPADLLRPETLEPKGKHALLTFDDGYFNNQRALALLQRYRVPALFFVNAGLVQEGKAHWYDVLYRARRRQGVPVEEACREVAGRVQATTEAIESRLARETGLKEFKPASDVDRVFTPAELRAFAAHPEVFIGNHCWTHAFLPAYSTEEARAEIVRGHNGLRDITGKPPLAIGYPSGEWTAEALRCCEELGLRLGFSTLARKEYLPAVRDSKRRLTLGRFCLWGNTEIESQCQFMRSDVMGHLLYEQTVRALKRLAGRRE